MDVGDPIGGVDTAELLGGPDDALGGQEVVKDDMREGLRGEVLLPQARQLPLPSIEVQVCGLSGTR